ncbi:hypothetical protein SAMN05444272_0712 [Roseibium suaedae]|uniref:Uncharacterized protein n=1 Tax=Roseibium suaedae TaxID=735517 RepID=A0A1M7B2M1_9HYPH|nr:hypothetical protein SAMN05444272_0712 [Roseibium suaedae]
MHPGMGRAGPNNLSGASLSNFRAACLVESVGRKKKTPEPVRGEIDDKAAKIDGHPGLVPSTKTGIQYPVEWALEKTIYLRWLLDPCLRRDDNQLFEI